MQLQEESKSLAEEMQKIFYIFNHYEKNANVIKLFYDMYF